MRTSTQLSDNLPFYQRTVELHQALQEKFKVLDDNTNIRHVFVDGVHCFYSIYGMPREEILDSAIEQKTEDDLKNQPITVLDIGAEDFSFVDNIQTRYQGTVTVYGIAARGQYNQHKQNLNNKHYVFANAEYVSESFVKERFDFIFSSRTYMHFGDPIGSIIEAYRILKPGGILMIDQFCLRGCEKYAEALLDLLNKQGYQVIGDTNSENISEFVIKKPADGRLPELHFPLALKDIHDGDAFYQPLPELQLAFDARPPKDAIYEKGCEMVIQSAEAIDKALLNRCQNLVELFSDIGYQSLAPSKQYLFILAIVAKTTLYVDLPNLYHSCRNKDINANFSSTNVASDIDRLIKSHRGHCLCLLSSDFYFNNYETSIGKNGYCENDAYCQQLRIIELAAVEGILFRETYQQKRICSDTMKSMKLPIINQSSFNFESLISEYDASPNKPLTFPAIAKWHQQNKLKEKIANSPLINLSLNAPPKSQPSGDQAPLNFDMKLKS